MRSKAKHLSVTLQTYNIKVFLSPSLQHRLLMKKMTCPKMYILTKKGTVIHGNAHTSQCNKHKWKRNTELLG